MLKSWSLSDQSPIGYPARPSQLCLMQDSLLPARAPSGQRTGYLLGGVGDEGRTTANAMSRYCQPCFPPLVTHEVAREFHLTDSATPPSAPSGPPQPDSVPAASVRCSSCDA